MIGIGTISSSPRFCWAVLTRGVLAWTIGFGFSVFQNRGETSAKVASAYDFREVKDLMSVTITISESEYAFFCCYHYSLSVHGDGRVEYYGQLGSFVPGLHRSRLSDAEILRLLDAFRAADFYSLHDESNLLVRDAPSFTIALSVDGHSRSVTDHSRESTAFRALMDRIIEISHAQLWLQHTPDTLQAILADSENLNSADDEGRNVLMWACERADVAAVRELIRSGADVRAKDRQGRTAMMYAAARQSPEIVEELLHSDAGVNEQNSSGQMALHFASSPASPIWSAFNQVADYPEPPATSFWPGLFLPAEPHPEVIAHLLAAGADPNAVDFEGATPLMYTAEMGSQEVLRALLAAGADPDAQDAEGRTALMYAADHLQTESVRLLVQAGANITLRDCNGLTALKRVRRKPSKFMRKMFSSSREQIIHILQVAQTSR